MSHLIAALGLRFALAAFIYVCTVAVWVSNVRGWEAVGLFGMSVIFGFFAAAALAAAAVIGRMIANRILRLIVQPIVMVLLFAALSLVIAGTLMGLQNDVAKDMRPFLVLVAAIAAIDTLVGHALDGWVARRQAMA